jgi:hypothetical protein
MQTEPREARLRLEYSALYPTITPGVWQPAARVAERLLLYLLRHPALLDRLPERLLNEHHFEFRGGSPIEGHAARRLQVGQRPEDTQDEQRPLA